MKTKGQAPALNSCRLRPLLASSILAILGYSLPAADAPKGLMEEIGDPRAIPILTEIAKDDPIERVREAAQTAVKEIKKKAAQKHGTNRLEMKSAQDGAR